MTESRGARARHSAGKPCGRGAAAQPCCLFRSRDPGRRRRLDDAAAIRSRRSHFYPAPNVNGNAVPDTVTTPPIVWRLEG